MELTVLLAHSGLAAQEAPADRTTLGVAVVATTVVAAAVVHLSSRSPQLMFHIRRRHLASVIRATTAVS